MRVRLLGPIDVLVGGEPRPVQGLRRKAVLAILGLHAGEVVSTGRLVELVWDGAAPPNAVNALQSHLCHLGDAYADLGDAAAAAGNWRRSAEILDEFDPGHAAAIRAKLPGGAPATVRG